MWIEFFRLLGYDAACDGLKPTFCQYLSGCLQGWPFKIGPIDSPETSVSNHLTPLNNPEDRKIQFNRGRSLRCEICELLSSFVSFVGQVRRSALCASWSNTTFCVLCLCAVWQPFSCFVFLSSRNNSVTVMWFVFRIGPERNLPIETRTRAEVEQQIRVTFAAILHDLRKIAECLAVCKSVCTALRSMLKSYTKC